MTAFTTKTGIPLDPVYTGKLLYALADKMLKGMINEKENVLAIHTGGLQGLAGYAYRFPEQWGGYVTMVKYD